LRESWRRSACRFLQMERNRYAAIQLSKNTGVRSSSALLPPHLVVGGEKKSFGEIISKFADKNFFEL